MAKGILNELNQALVTEGDPEFWIAEFVDLRVSGDQDPKRASIRKFLNP